MKIILFSHPAFLASQSMPRYANMLAQAYRARGHEVEVWTATAKVRQWAEGTRWAKWAGYVDQYLIFPRQVRQKLRAQSADTLYVFCDQALGPWVPLVRHLPHVVHAHDLLALRSALGLIPENPTSVTGRLYQRYIRQGFQQAKHFISVSSRTRSDLLEHAGVPLEHVDVVYNGLNQAFAPVPPAMALPLLSKAGLPDTEAGFLLHVGGSQWYKNTAGVLKIYHHYLNQQAQQMQPALPLVMVCPPPSGQIAQALSELPAGADVRFVQDLDSPTLKATYAMARVFLFPSLAEGFGWPIVEAQACGTVVLTTDDSPMNEVGGSAPCYLRRLTTAEPMDTWARDGAQQLASMLVWTHEQRQARVQQGLEWAQRFGADDAIEAYLAVYRKVLASTRL
jgi:glycosyltransferase involved in cell wall biosynthesis